MPASKSINISWLVLRIQTKINSLCLSKEWILVTPKINLYFFVFRLNEWSTCRRNRRGIETNPWRYQRSHCWGHRTAVCATCTSAHRSSLCYTSGWRSLWKQRNLSCPHKMHSIISHSRADLLVYRLLKLLVVEDGAHLSVAVARPKGGHNLDWRLTHILSGKV